MLHFPIQHFSCREKEKRDILYDQIQINHEERDSEEPIKPKKGGSIEFVCFVPILISTSSDDGKISQSTEYGEDGEEDLNPVPLVEEIHHLMNAIETRTRICQGLEGVGGCVGGWVGIRAGVRGGDLPSIARYYMCPQRQLYPSHTNPSPRKNHVQRSRTACIS